MKRKIVICNGRSDNCGDCPHQYEHEWLDANSDYTGDKPCTMSQPCGPLETFVVCKAVERKAKK